MEFAKRILNKEKPFDNMDFSNFILPLFEIIKKSIEWTICWEVDKNDKCDTILILKNHLSHIYHSGNPMEKWTSKNRITKTNLFSKNLDLPSHE